MNPERARAIYDAYAAGVAWVETIDEKGNPGIGSAFHLGNGYFATAGHVVEGVVQRAGTTIGARHVFRTELGIERVELDHLPGESAEIDEAIFHPEGDVDLALLRIHGLDAPTLRLVDESAEAGERLTLRPVLVMGYPRVPGSPDPPPLLASQTQISGTTKSFLGGPKTMLLGTMARGGFSGGPVLSSDGHVLGVMTRSLVADAGQVEQGFLSALQSVVIRACLADHGVDLQA